MTIKSGQLVVIVGANGSGKTSLTKLLTRLYDPTSGQVLVDSQPVSSYRLKDLREATALLSQDHNLFPLSIAENIATGLSQNADNDSQVRAAAEKGGARSFIQKLGAGMDTVLQPTATKGSWGLSANHPLTRVLNTWEKSTDVSGGSAACIACKLHFEYQCCH
jgi:ABC-type multidrug transport system fused ATPase/permease subunit